MELHLTTAPSNYNSLVRRQNKTPRTASTAAMMDMIQITIKWLSINTSGSSERILSSPPEFRFITAGKEQVDTICLVFFSLI